MVEGAQDAAQCAVCGAALPARTPEQRRRGGRQRAYCGTRCRRRRERAVRAAVRLEREQRFWRVLAARPGGAAVIERLRALAGRPKVDA